MKLIDVEKGQEVIITEINWNLDPSVNKLVIKLTQRGFVEGATVTVKEKTISGSVCSVKGMSFYISKEALNCFRVHSKYKRP